MLGRELGVADLPLYAVLFGALGLLVVFPVFFFFSGRSMDQIEKLAKAVEKITPEECSQKIAWEQDDPCKPISDKIDMLVSALQKARHSEQNNLVRLKAFETLCPDTLIIFRDTGEIVESLVRVREEILPSVESLVTPGNNVYNNKVLLSQGDKIRLAEIDSISQKGKCLVTEISIRDSSGGLMWFETRICRLCPGLLIASCRDNTVFHTAGLEHAAIQEKINQIQRTENFGLIASGLAHDYNNMLTAMQGNVELLLCEDISDEVREMVEDIKVAMHRSSKLVHKMLAHVCKADPVEEKIDMNGLIANLMRLVRRSLPDNAEVDFKPAEKLPVIAADSVQVWQVVMNLVVNACDALHGRRGFVHVRTGVKHFDSKDFAPFKNSAPLKPGLFALLEVEDSGLGMDENTRKRIFNPFFTTKPTGRGLGLASVASVVTSCRGGIDVESEVGVGTTFRIIVPVCLDAEGKPLYAVPETNGKSAAYSPAEHSAPLPAAASDEKQNVPKAAAPLPPPKPVDAPKEVASKSKASPNAKKSILVVDDDSSILKLLKIILSAGGYQVSVAASGEEGLKIYEASEKGFDLALIDASMGAGMSGLDLCAAIRKKSTMIPLVLMSAYRAKEMSAKMAASGVSGFLAKPFRSADVLETISRYCFAPSASMEGPSDGAI